MSVYIRFCHAVRVCILLQAIVPCDMILAVWGLEILATSRRLALALATWAKRVPSLRQTGSICSHPVGSCHPLVSSCSKLRAGSQYSKPTAATMAVIRPSCAPLAGLFLVDTVTVTVAVALIAPSCAYPGPCSQTGSAGPSAP